MAEEIRRIGFGIRNTVRIVKSRTPKKMDTEITAKIQDHPSHSSLKAFAIAAEISSALNSVILPWTWNHLGYRFGKLMLTGYFIILTDTGIDFFDYNHAGVTIGYRF